MAAPYVLDSLNPPVATPAVVTKKEASRFSFPGKIFCWGAAALIASLLALPVAVTFDGRFPVENLDVEMTNRIRNNRTDAVAWAKERSNRWESMYRTTVACLTGFGAALGGVAALLGSVSTATVLTRLRWLAVGVVLGAVCAAVGAFLEAGLLIKIEKLALDPMLRTMIGHAVAWLVIGGGVAIAATLSTPKWGEKRSAIGRTCVGAIGAAVVYTPSAAIMFQLLRSDLPIPEGVGNKLLFLALAAVSMFGMLAGAPTKVPASSLPSVQNEPVNSLSENSPMAAA